GNDCLGFWSACNPKNDKCCANLVCSSKHKWCKGKL
uniref:Hs1a n=1 Tax=Hysterocrates TaxID=118971 RepID=A0A0M3KKS8_9ARAC|nr:Chain A, Hs1a [Hysterocrates]